MAVSPAGSAMSPVGASGATGAAPELLTTAGTPSTPVVKLAASLPPVSWMTPVASSLPGLGSV